MSIATEIANSSPAVVSGGTVGIMAFGYAVLRFVRQFTTTRKESAADNGAASAYELLTKENKRMAEQLTALSIALNTGLTDKMDLMQRMGEMERKVRAMADLERENQALQAELAEIRSENATIRRENHDLRDKVQVLEFRVSQIDK